MMQHFKQKFIFLIAVLFSVIIMSGYTTARAATKLSYPKVVFSTYPVTEYKAGDRVQFNIKSPGYKGKVEYRVVLWEDAKKSYRDLWNPKNGYPTYYYSKWRPLGDETFKLGWNIDEPGSYRITVYAKRAGIPNSKGIVKGANCDSYIQSVAFVVKPKVTGLNLDKDGMIHETDHPEVIENIKSNVNILAKNVTFSNADVEGNVNVLSDNAMLNNLNVHGTIVINPGDRGTVTLNDVSASSIIILSGTPGKVNLNRVSGSELKIDSKSKTELELKEETGFSNTSISSDASLYSNGGNFGDIAVFHKKSGKITVDLKGLFGREISVYNNVLLRAEEDSDVRLITLTPDNDSVGAELDGKFVNVLIAKPGAVVLYPGTSVSQFVNNDYGYLYLDSQSSIQNLKSNGDALYVEGTGSIGERSGNIIYYSDKSQLPGTADIAGTASISAQYGYAIVDSMYGDDYMYSYMDMYILNNEGKRIDVTQGKLFYDDEIDVTMEEVRGDDYYRLYLNPDDGTLALREGNYTLYFPSGDKWYVVKFTAKLAGKPGEYRSEIISVNGNPYKFERYKPQGI